MKSIVALFCIGFIIALAPVGSGCKKDAPPKTINDTIIKQDTITTGGVQHCHMTSSNSYDANGNIQSSVINYFTGIRQDSTIFSQYSNGNITASQKQIFVYSSSTYAIANTYANGVLQSQNAHLTFDANGNIVRDEVWNNGVLQGYSTSTFTCQ